MVPLGTKKDYITATVLIAKDGVVIGKKPKTRIFTRDGREGTAVHDGLPVRKSGDEWIYEVK